MLKKILKAIEQYFKDVHYRYTDGYYIVEERE